MSLPETPSHASHPPSLPAGLPDDDYEPAPRVLSRHLQSSQTPAVQGALHDFALFGVRSDELTRWAIGPLKRIGLRDLDHDQVHAEEGHEGGNGFDIPRRSLEALRRMGKA